VFAYVIYYMVIALFAGLAMLVGRRAGCHSLCWMAPFMILGRKIRNLTAWHSLRLKASPDRCTDCKTCTYNCPMSLDVNGMVKLGAMEHTECILCGTCVDNCPTTRLNFLQQREVTPGSLVQLRPCTRKTLPNEKPGGFY
jgi:polyferredoxin